MTDKIKIPYNDIFFYGISLNSRDVTDVRTDIFANILMRYLRTLKPVSSKLYRTSDGSKFEYAYSFIPGKPLSWRVIKNRRIVEEIEQLSDGKYCLNYYDDQGRDVKCVLFSNQHKWIKTNYYNVLNGNVLFCSLVPKEVNGETVILQYITGETYPVTLYCCPAASCQEVLIKVLGRVPTPEAMALTNYGPLYFAQSETLNIYKQVLQEEEEVYAELHKPEVFTTKEDVAGGFCFDVSSFDSTKSTGAMFNLSEAEELSDDGFDTVSSIPIALEKVEDDTASSDVIEPISLEAHTTDSSKAHEYSLEADIADAIRIISDATDVHIDESVVFSFDTQPQESSIDPVVSESKSNSDEAGEIDTDEIVPLEDASESVTSAPGETPESIKNIDSLLLSVTPSEVGLTPAKDDVFIAKETPIVNEDDIVSFEEPSVSETELTESVDLLSMNDDAIDDYVQTLIDSLLLDAKTVTEYKDSADNAFTAGGNEAAVEVTSQQSNSTEDLLKTPADLVVESNGAQYFYYGDTDSSGQRSGRGKTLMADGKTAYDGEYKDDMRHGEGSFYYKDGSLCYWGEWNRNMRSGFGVGISSETGTIHTGSWNNNKPVGVGVRFDKDGRFMYIDSACHHTNGGIRITAFTDKSFTVEYWDETTLKTVKKEIFIDELFKD
ncbi:MAG: hypothetical protein E7563_03180 [Ruminococcaceae bacterium]|nr:hypothetical protein [Oscillospiraceae bacterium]